MPSPMFLPGVGLCPGGVSFQGFLSRVSFQGFLSRGITVQGGLCPGGGLCLGKHEKMFPRPQLKMVELD